MLQDLILTLFISEMFAQYAELGGRFLTTLTNVYVKMFNAKECDEKHLCNIAHNLYATFQKFWLCFCIFFVLQVQCK